MKRRVWKHTCISENVDGFIEEKTGKTIKEITAWTGKNFIRFPEVKEKLLEASRTGQLVCLVGDYDSDGINSVNIMTKLFQKLGIKFQLYIPKRESEGYGLSWKIMDRIPDNCILITIDNGITAIEQMKSAKEHGMYTIILDHHTAGDTLPDVDILIDPSAIGEADYTHYCGAGIAYRLAEYILGENDPIMKDLSVFAAIATIGDVVELSGDNRQVVIEGMNNAKEGYGTNAVKYLLEKAKFNIDSTSTDIAFNVVPVLNAPERLEDGGAAKVCQAMLKNGSFEDSVNWLIEQNTRRKDIVSAAMQNIDLEELKKNSDNVIMLKDNNIPLGIAGIVAGKLSEETGKPSFVFGVDADGNLKGSSRSNIQNLSIIEIIRMSSDKLVNGGGHAGAAGLSIKEEDFEEFKKEVNENISKKLDELKENGEFTEFDSEEYTKWDVTASDLTISAVADKILSLEPTGEGLPAPKVRIKSRLVKASPFGGSADCPETEKPHIRFTFAGFTAIGFFMNDWYQEQKKLVSNVRFAELVGVVGKNTYNGKTTIQIRMDDFELS